MGIAETAIAALGDPHPVADPGEIGDQRLIILFVDLGAGGNLEGDIAGIGAGPQPAHAMAAGRRLEMLLVAVIDEGVETVDRLRPDIAAIAAVAAIGAAQFDEFLAPE